MKSQLAVIANSFNFKRSGDILYALEDGWQPEYKYKRTIYNDNSRIPLIWYGKGIGKGSSLKQVEAVDMVPTILYSLGMGIPKHCTGRIIEDVLQGN